MKPWQKVPSAIVRNSMRARLAEERAASEVEALAEMQVLEDGGELAAMSFLALAQHLGWSRSRLRNALAAWGRLADTVPEQRDMMPTLALRKDPKDNMRTTAGQSEDNGWTTTGQHRSKSNADFGGAEDNQRTTAGQSEDNQRTPSRARVSSWEIETEIKTAGLTMSAQPTIGSDPRGKAPAEPDEEVVEAEYLPAPRAAQPELILLPPGPRVVAEDPGDPESLLRILNDVRSGLHPRVMPGFPSVRPLALTDKRRKALVEGWRALARIDADPEARRTLLRSGALYVYLSNAWPAQGARKTGEPIDTLLRPSHLAEYCEHGSADEELEHEFRRWTDHPVGWTPNYHDPDTYKRYNP